MVNMKKRRSILTIICLLLPLFPVMAAAPTTSFLGKMNQSIEDAAVTMIETLRVKDPDAFSESGVDIGVFSVMFSDGGILEIGQMAKETMISCLSMLPGVNVMGEHAYVSAPYAIKAKKSPPLQGEMNIAWVLESRQGDMDTDFKIIASAASRIALPADAVSRRNVLLYVKRPEGKAALPSVDVPLLDVNFKVFVERRTSKGWERIFIDNGGWLRSGEQFRISLEPNTDCYAYVVIQDSLGDLYSLFPAPGVRGGNRIDGGEARWLPGSDDKNNPLWYYLDDNTGTETLYLVADYEPIDNIDDFLAWFSGQSRDKRMESNLEGWTVGENERKNIRYQIFDGKSTEAMREHFPFVKAFEIEHR